MPNRDTDRTTIQQFSHLLGNAGTIAFLTGAGMSTESGIPDFRSPSGLYARRVSEAVFDVQTFERTPEAFYDFAREFFPDLMGASPNAGHLAIVQLQEQFAKRVCVVTQNIDTLHQQAGSDPVYPVHGTMETVTCTRCGDEQYTDTIWGTVAAGRIPWHVKCNGVYKPDIVFFGEMLPAATLMAAEKAMAAADLLVVLGTSLTVYPASMLPSYRRSDCALVIVNQVPTDLDDQATLVFHDSIGNVLSRAMAELGVMMANEEMV